MRNLLRSWNSLTLSLLVLLPLSVSAEAIWADGLSNWSLFGQTGWAESEVRTFAVGAQHPLPWHGYFRRAYWGSYAEVTVARWLTDEPEPGMAKKFTQFGASPVLRIQYPSLAPSLFMDLGVGAYVITPLYRTREKRFGSTYNFGDQIGVGFEFGQHRNYEVSLRVQHFSNGGIKKPNPGENFLQVRFVVRFAHTAFHRATWPVAHH